MIETIKELIAIMLLIVLGVIALILFIVCIPFILIGGLIFKALNLLTSK